MSLPTRENYICLWWRHESKLTRQQIQNEVMQMYIIVEECYVNSFYFNAIMNFNWIDDIQLCVRHSTHYKPKQISKVHKPKWFGKFKSSPSNLILWTIKKEIVLNFKCDRRFDTLSPKKTTTKDERRKRN